jgi:hypothetical protein
MREMELEIASAGWLKLSGISSTDVLDVAMQVGRIIPDPRTGAALRTLRPERSGDANPNTLSSRYGEGAFPFHTEAAYLRIPPRFNGVMWKPYNLCSI